ncbi:MFS transporter [Burkholderia sp. SG-MS1]|uniref:MFS transporter n=1 Tax=Paraburkholderia sp. SG-MS1 TaxID=2023741 RepID=UPI001447FB00|nr:MFS transporter [Paraburkholderia sp. SG-MS1]NKJ49236.1 MFS transporter [Paraburkholderia sp. SG-MS1]
MNDTATAPYTPAQRLAIIVSCMLGFALDLYDVLIMPFLMPSIQRSMHIELGEVASITTVTLIGSVIGGGVFGWFGDRIGRKSALQWTLVVFALASVGSAFAWNFLSLLVLRLIVGIGLGGEWGAGMVLFNETWNPQRRGLGTALIQGSATIAAAGASIVGLWAVGTFSVDWGWRIGLLTGGAPVILAVLIRFGMPESRAWQQYDRARRAGLSEPRGNTFAGMFSGRLRFISIAAALWLTAYMFCYYAIVIFVPSLMLRVLDTPPDVVRTATVTAAFVGSISYIAMGWLNDRLGRRFGAIVPGVCWLAALGILFVAPDARYAGSYLKWPIFWLPIVFAMGSSALGVVGAWLSELYPIEVRATAVSTIYMFGRAAGSLAPILVPVAATLFDHSLPRGMLVALPAAAVFLILSFALPETRGRHLTTGADAAASNRKPIANDGSLSHIGHGH